MRLCLLMHRRYPPYSKWLGTAFARLPGIAGLTASLSAALSADAWPVREQHLCDAYQGVAAMHNQLGFTPPLDTGTRRFYDRPYQVIDAIRFTKALREAISDPRIRELPLTGAIDQFTDSTDAAGDLRLLRACAEAAIRPEHRDVDRFNRKDLSRPRRSVLDGQPDGSHAEASSARPVRFRPAGLRAVVP
jgi:hypothetical protein